MSPYVVVAAVVVVGLLLFVAAIGARALLAPRAPTRAKLTTYESGVDPVGQGWAQTQVRYFNAEDRGNALAVATVVSGITHTEVGVARPALQAKPGTLEVWFSK